MPEAEKILRENLKPEEWKSIYYSRDVVGNDLNVVASILGVEIPTVKEYRRSGYDKLVIKYFPEKRKALWPD